MDQEMLQEISPIMEPAPTDTEPGAKLNIHQIVQECRKLVNDINMRQGTIINNEKELRRIQDIYQQQANSHSVQVAHEIQLLRDRISADQAELYVRRSKLIQAVYQGMELLHKNDLINQRLYTWRMNQKTEQIGAPFDRKEDEFDAIYTEFNALPQYISEFEKFARFMIEKLNEYPMDVAEAEGFVNNLNSVLFQLNNNGPELGLPYLMPVVSIQPEPVLKTNAKMNPLELHVLGAEKMDMKEQLVGVEFTVDIITEEAAGELVARRLQPNQVKVIGKIANPIQEASLNEKQQVVVKFSDCKLESVKRRIKSGAKEAAIDQKYVLLFHSKPLSNGFIMWALSLPVMVSVHVSQDCYLYSTICWLRAFGSLNYNDERKEAASPVPWPTLARAIMRLFALYTKATQPLSNTAMNYLAEKMFGPAPPNDPTRKQTFVTFDRFAKTEMNNEVKFSCWNYIYSIMQLLNRQNEVLKFWNNGWVFGFISKQDAAEKIVAHNYPTFLLRFSDTQLGALSIACAVETVFANGAQGRRTDHLVPFAAKELQKVSITQIVWGCERLQNIQYLYPNVAKQNIIANMIEPPCKSGYVRAIIAVMFGATCTVDKPSPAAHHSNTNQQPPSPTDGNGNGNGIPMEQQGIDESDSPEADELSIPFPPTSPLQNLAPGELDEILNGIGIEGMLS